MNQPTSERLALALEELKDPKLVMLIDLVRAKYFDEYEGELGAPLVTLVGDLRALGHSKFANRVINGDFDATREEAEAWFEREGKHIVAGFGRKP